MKMTKPGSVTIFFDGKIETHDFEWNADDRTIEFVSMQYQALKWAQGILEDKLRELTTP